MKKKNIYFAILGVLLLLLILLAFLLLNKPAQEITSPSNYVPEFLSQEQKEQFGLAAETKAQVFYDEDGQLIYKIIKDDSDIISDIDNYNLED